MKIVTSHGGGGPKIGPKSDTYYLNGPLQTIYKPEYNVTVYNVMMLPFTMYKVPVNEVAVLPLIAV